MNESPFGTNLSELQQNYYKQLAALQQMQQGNPVSVLDNIKQLVSSMSSEEQSLLSESPEYLLAKQTYEAGFMSFLGQKFSNEYINTQEGSTAANNLLNSIKSVKEKIEIRLKEKQKKLNDILELLDKDPDLKKKYDEMILNKKID